MTTDEALQHLVSSGWTPEVRYDGLGRWVAEATRWEQDRSETRWARGESPLEALSALEQRLSERVEVSA